MIQPFNLANGARRLLFLLKNPQFRRFSVVGIVGFLVDAGILTILMKMEYSSIVARSVSFPSAVTVTWLLNKAWSFSDSGPPRPNGYVAYIVIQMIGAGINFSIFVFILWVWPFWSAWPIAPLAVAAAASLIFNFTMSRRHAFGQANP